MVKEHCTWTGFYSRLADKLLTFKNDRRSLMNKLLSLYEGVDMKLPKLDSSSTPADIDPYTVFGLFNKGISDTNRRKIVSAFAEAFGIEADQPKDFQGVPTLNNLNATFYAFKGDGRRGEHDIDNLWRTFEAEIKLAAEDSELNRAEFVEAYDATIGQFGLGWKLTMGLYWVRPYAFVSLDSRNRWYLGDMKTAGPVVASAFPKEKGSPIPSGAEYLAICDVVRSQLGSKDCPYQDFPLSPMPRSSNPSVSIKRGRLLQKPPIRRPRKARWAMPAWRRCIIGFMRLARVQACGKSFTVAA